MTGGMAFEGLNNLGHSGRDCIIVLNDNGRSYAPTISRLGESLARLRSNPRFRRGKARAADRVVARCPSSARLEAGPRRHEGGHPPDARAAGVLREARRPLPRPLRRARHRRRRGAPFGNAAEMDGPVVVHVLTQKGRGYAPAENDPIKRMHDLGGAKPGSYTAAFTEALLKVGEERPEVVAITAAMPDSTGLLPFQDRFPDRFFDVGIAEQHAVTAAAGMATGGLNPVVALYSTFLTRAIDQVNLDVGLHGSTGRVLPRSGRHHRRRRTVPPRHARHGAPQQGAGHDDLRPLLLPGAPGHAGRRDRPRRSGRHPLAQDRGAATCRSTRSASAGGPGNSATDPMSASSRSARWSLPRSTRPTTLEADGISTSVWDARCVAPLDGEMLDDAIGHPAVVTAEDGLIDGGVGESMVRHLLDRDPGLVQSGQGPGRTQAVPAPRQGRRHPGRPGSRRRRAGVLGAFADHRLIPTGWRRGVRVRSRRGSRRPRGRWRRRPR